MELNNYSWNDIRLVDVFRAQSGEAGVHLLGKGSTDIFQLGLKLSGVSDITYDGKRYSFAADSVLYLPKEKRGDVEYKKTISESGESICIFFESSSRLPTTPFLADNVDSYLQGMFARLCGMYRRRDRDIFACMSTFYDILSALNGEMKPKHDDMADALAYLDEHASDKYVEIRVLAERAGMSEDRFRHKFKQRYNASPLEYFHMLKTEHAKVMLHDKGASVGTVALSLGFEDLNYFSRFFKKHVGVSPSEYKKKCMM